MSAKFYTLLTDIGAAKLANAAALGVPLKITHMAVGSGGGVLPTPNAQQTALVAEERRAALNMLYIDPQNSSQIIAEQVIPENEGGWWIREVGLFDETGALIAVGNCPESYKPKLAEGSGRTQTVRMVLITSSTDNITLKIDPAVVLATRKYVDDKVLELKVYVDDLMAKHLAATDPHTQYAPKASPTFTGTPKAPTAPAGNNSTQLANTAFVQAAIAALVASSPAALDTLNELAAALGNDPNFATTVTNALAGKMDKAANGSDIADVSAFLKNLRLGAGAPAIGIPFFWPSSAMPNTVMDEWSDMVFLKWNGATFSATEYPKLARIIPGLKLNDVRGEFLRIWDDGRGVDTGRSLLSPQRESMIRSSLIDYFGVDSTASGSAMGVAVANFDSKTTTQPANAVAPDGNTPLSGVSADNGFTGSQSNIPSFLSNWSGVRPRNIAFNFLVRAK